MRKPLLLIVCFLALIGCSPSKPTQQTTAVNTADSSPSVSDAELLAEFTQAKNNLFRCYNDFWKGTGKRTDDQRKADLDKLSACTKSRDAELGIIYQRISKSSTTIFQLLTQDQDEQYRDSSYNLNSTYKQHSEVEMNSDHQVELQRILVLQNQRIIELLEQLSAKKP